MELKSKISQSIIHHKGKEENPFALGENEPKPREFPLVDQLNAKDRDCIKVGDLISMESSSYFYGNV